MENELIKVDRNGSKHWRGRVECDRCGGNGYYAIGVCNGKPVLSPLDAGVCWKCHGNGWVIDEWIERTPEYQAKLDAKRAAKQAARQAEIDAECARIAAERKAEENRKEAERKAREAEKAISQYVGAVGSKLTLIVDYVGSPYFERRCFGGYGTETCYIHTFKTGRGDKLVWKTGKGLALEPGTRCMLSGTIKEHAEYKSEKQTSLIRCKVEPFGETPADEEDLGDMDVESSDYGPSNPWDAPGMKVSDFIRGVCYA